MLQQKQYLNKVNVQAPPLGQLRTNEQDHQYNRQTCKNISKHYVYLFISFELNELTSDKTYSVETKQLNDALDYLETYFHRSFVRRVAIAHLIHVNHTHIH